MNKSAFASIRRDKGWGLPMGDSSAFQLWLRLAMIWMLALAFQPGGIPAVWASSWQVINTGKGLPSNAVMAFAIGNNQMAVGTDQGLAVYDGETAEWSVLALPSPYEKVAVRDLAYDAKNHLWAAVAGGLLHIQGRNIETYTVKDGLPTTDVERVQVKKNVVYVGGFGGYVCKAFVPDVGRTAFTPVNYVRPSEEEGFHIRSVGISGLAMRDEASGWISTKGAGLLWISGMSEWVLDASKGLSTDWIEAFWVFEGFDKAEHLLVTSRHDLALFRERSLLGIVKPPLESEDLWLTSIVAFTNPALPKPPRKGVNQDWSLVTFLGQRELWVGTKGQGLFRFRNGKWTHYTSSNSVLPSPYVRRLYFHQGRVIACTDEGLVIIPINASSYDEFKYIGIGQRFKTIYPYPEESSVNCISKKNDFWIAGSAGLARFVGVSGSSAGFMTPAPDISASMEAPPADPEAATAGGGRPVTLTGELKWDHFNRDNGTLPSNAVNPILADDFGATWVVLNEKQFGRVRVERLPPKARKDGFPDKYHWDWFKPQDIPWPGDTKLTALFWHDGKLYVGTMGFGFYILKNPGAVPDAQGLCQFDWDHYGQLEGLWREKVIGFARQATADGKGKLALLHPDGLTLWDGRSFESVSLDSERKYRCIAGDYAGNLWLGTETGLIRLIPDGREIRYSSVNANFESNIITAVCAPPYTGAGSGFAIWVACDAKRGNLDVYPTVVNRRVREPDIDGASLHYFDGVIWDKWKVAGVRCMLADGDYLWLGTNCRLRRLYIPSMVP